MIKRTLAVLALIALLIAPLTASAEGPVRVTARVDGLSCPFCAYGIEKKVKKIEGVRDIRVDIKGGTVTVIYEDRKFFARKRLERAIKDAGFTPGEVKVEDEVE